MMKVYLLLPLVLTAHAQYSLNFNSPDGGLTYEYDTAVDFTNVSMQFVIHPDPEFTSAAPNGIEQFITVESTLNDAGYMDFFYIDILPPYEGGAATENMLMATFATPKSSNALDTLTYCLTIVPFNFTTEQRVIHINKTGSSFSMTIDGTADNIYCADNAIGAPETGSMTMNKIKISSYQGCISQLQFPEIDFLPADECGFPDDYITGDVTYFEGQCVGGGSQEEKVCPTTPPPTTSGATSTASPTHPPEPTTEGKATTEAEASESSSEPTTDTSSSQSTSAGPTEMSSVPTEDVPDNNSVEPNENPTYIINEAEEASGEETSPDNKAVIIIIVVVAGGILVVVVLLYVGYRFHFRDKGSYKLDEAKTEPTDDYGNEYTDLNPTTKDQEWYL